VFVTGVTAAFTDCCVIDAPDAFATAVAVGDAAVAADAAFVAVDVVDRASDAAACGADTVSPDAYDGAFWCTSARTELSATPLAASAPSFAFVFFFICSIVVSPSLSMRLTIR
jgi:hypothetical protein